MKLQRLQVNNIVFSMIISLCFATNFTGMLDFPFSKITLNDKNFNASFLNFKCTDKFSNTKECAEQCYYSEKYGGECVAFLKYINSEECHICITGTIAEIMSSTNTKIKGSDAVFILKNEIKKPAMYLPLEGDNITGTTVIGDGVNGTIIHEERIQIQAGKVNQGLHISNGGRLFLDNTANACINHLELCSNGLSIGLWVKPSNLGNNFRYITHGERSINIAIGQDRRIGSWTTGQTKKIGYISSQSTALVNTWIHVAVVYDLDVGLFLYINGTLEAIKSISEELPHNAYGIHDYDFGGKNNADYDFDGTLDEIKVFYETLTKTGKLTDSTRM